MFYQRFVGDNNANHQQQRFVKNNRNKFKLFSKNRASKNMEKPKNQRTLN